MSELSFLIDLLLNHKLAKVTRDCVAARIKEVETNFTAPKVVGVPSPASFITNLGDPSKYVPQQAASTIAAMARHANSGVVSAATIEAMQETVDMARSFNNPNTIAIIPRPEMPPIPATPVTVIAQTPAAAAAMNSRNQAISDSINGKTDKLSGRPRKF